MCVLSLCFSPSAVLGDILWVYRRRRVPVSDRVQRAIGFLESNGRRTRTPPRYHAPRFLAHSALSRRSSWICPPRPALPPWRRCGLRVLAVLRVEGLTAFLGRLVVRPVIAVVEDAFTERGGAFGKRSPSRSSSGAGVAFFFWWLWGSLAGSSRVRSSPWCALPQMAWSGEIPG